jgi:hypothetical protein
MTEPEQNETAEDNSGKRYVVKTPWHVDTLHDPDGNFPDVTPKGVEMDANEREAAKAAAKQGRIKLLSKEV